MKLFTPEGDELMDVGRLQRDGNELVVVGTIMGTMPTQAVLRPAQVRKLFGLLSLRIVLFIVSMPFRRDNPRDGTRPNPLAGLLDDY